MAGEVKMLATNREPAGYLFCDGRLLRRDQFSELFSVIGEAFGRGDGSTTFNIPDFRNRLPQCPTVITQSGKRLESSARVSDHYHLTGFAGGNNGGGDLIDKNQNRTAPAGIANAVRYWNGSGGWQGQVDVTGTYSGNALTSLQVGGDVSNIQPPALTVGFFIRI